MFLVSDLLECILRLRKLKSLGVEFPFFKGWKSGFNKSTINICGITKQNYKEFLSDKDYALGHPFNGVYSSIIDNKLYLPMFLHKYKELIPKYYFFIDECGLLALDDSPNSGSRCNFSIFSNVLKKVGCLALKHTFSSSGKGFMVLKFISGKYFLNGNSIDENHLADIVLSLHDYIVTEYVVQHSYASSICDTSLNTIRFLCMWDYEKKEFFLARCFQRFGCNGNIVDNVGSGNGLCVFVDVETGRLTDEGNINYGNSGDVFSRNIVHPDRGIDLTGLEIPRFNQVKNTILGICNENSFLRYAGFDVAITEENFKILEINSYSSLDAVQQRSGFLTDSRIRRVLSNKS